MIISNIDDYDITLKIRNCVLSRVESAKFLGITLDHKLNFEQHVINVSKKMSRSIGAINRVKTLLPSHVLCKLYYSLVYSHLTYAVIVWGESSLGN